MSNPDKDKSLLRKDLLKRASEGEHPLNDALRDIAYGLAKSGRWPDLAFDQRQQLFLHAKSLHDEPWRVFDVGVQGKLSPKPVDTATVISVVERALEGLGFEVSKEVFNHDAFIISPPILHMSAHARMEILGRIAPLLAPCEEAERETP